MCSNSPSKASRVRAREASKSTRRFSCHTFDFTLLHHLRVMLISTRETRQKWWELEPLPDDMTLLVSRNTGCGRVRTPDPLSASPVTRRASLCFSRALPTGTKVENGTSQSKIGTSVHRSSSGDFTLPDHLRVWLKPPDPLATSPVPHRTSLYCTIYGYG